MHDRSKGGDIALDESVHWFENRRHQLWHVSYGHISYGHISYGHISYGILVTAYRLWHIRFETDETLGAGAKFRSADEREGRHNHAQAIRDKIAMTNMP